MSYVLDRKECDCGDTLEQRSKFLHGRSGNYVAWVHVRTGSVACEAQEAVRLSGEEL